MLIAGALGLGAFWRRVRRRSAASLPGVDPAVELRERLAQAKVAAETPAAQPYVEAEPRAAEPAAAQASEPAALDPATRRRSIHERARDAIDELR